MNFGVIIIGDEIMSGKRTDKHLPQAIKLMGARGLQLAYAHYVGDDPQRLTALLAVAFASGDVVFSFGGIGATPDDHTRQCAAQALGCELVLHPEAKVLIRQRMQDIALQAGLPFEPERDDNLHRLNMGRFPSGAAIIPNPYNKIPGFSCVNAQGAGVHFVPGFPVMAWPMVELVLDTRYAHCFDRTVRLEKSVIVMGAMEATLTPLMELIEHAYAVKVFSLPSVDHPEYGRHIELGVKGEALAVETAYEALRRGLENYECTLGPEIVRTQS